MVRAWYMDSSDADQRLEHHRQPPEFVSLDNLFATTGVEYFEVRNTPIFQIDYCERSILPDLAISMMPSRVCLYRVF